MSEPLDTFFTFKNSWFAWIPTNIGSLSADLLAKDDITKKFGKKSTYFLTDSPGIVYKNLDISFVSDSLESKLLTLFFSRQKQYPLSSDAYISCVNDNFTGTIKFYNPLLEINASFSVSSKGIIEINPIKIEYKKSTNQKLTVDPMYRDSVESVLAAVVYNIVKLLFHLDGHHHQKIDTVLTVYKNKMDYNGVLKSFARHVKKVESFIKRTSNNSSHLKKIYSIHEVDGYISYAKTFNTIFYTKINRNNKILELIENVRMSLDAKLQKSQIRFHYFSGSISLILTYVGIMLTVLFSTYKFILKGNGSDILAKDQGLILGIMVVVLAIPLVWKSYELGKNVLFILGFKGFETIQYFIWGKNLFKRLKISFIILLLLLIWITTLVINLMLTAFQNL